MRRSVTCGPSAGDFVIDPDEQVQAVVRLIFEQFTRRGSVNGLLRWLVRHDVKLPIRPHFGAEPRRTGVAAAESRDAVEHAASSDLCRRLSLGASRSGSAQESSRTADHRPHVQLARRVPRADSRPLPGLHHLGANSRKTSKNCEENSTLGQAALGTPARAERAWPGWWSAAAAAIACWSVIPTALPTKTLRYSCQREAIDYGQDVCQSLSGAVLESFVVERLLQAVSPASLELSLAATADIERERKQLDDHWQQRLTRSRYEVEQARRQYAAVDPEHRLVARELERRWDEALRARRAVAGRLRPLPAGMPDATLAAASGSRFSRWRKTCRHCGTPIRRRPKIGKRSPGCCLEQVTVTVEGNTDRVDVELRWAGGFVSRHTSVSSRANLRAVVELRRTRGPHRCIACRTQDVVRDRRDAECRRLPPAEAIAAIHQRDLEPLLA